MMIPAFDAVNAQHPQLFRERFITRHHHAAVAVRAKVFGRIKTKASQTTETSHRLSEVSRANGLRAIFNQWNISPLSYSDQFFQRRRLAKQMKGNNCLD